MERIAADLGATRAPGPGRPASPSDLEEPGLLDLVIVGGGVAGMSAAIEAKRRGLRFEVLEASEPFSTIANFPKRKPI